MNHWMTGGMSVAMAVVGWWYLWYAKPSALMVAIEGESASKRRLRIRRASGVVLLVMAALFYAGMETVSWTASPMTYVGVWSGVMILLGVLAVLALLDVMMTIRLRRRPPGDRS